MSRTRKGHAARPDTEKRRRKRARAGRALRRASRREMAERDAWATEACGEFGHASCGRKVRYDTEGVAERFAVRETLRGGVAVTTYRCGICGGWHLTSHPLADEEVAARMAASRGPEGTRGDGRGPDARRPRQGGGER